MKTAIAATVILSVVLVIGGIANAQQQPAAPAASPLDVVPEKMPFYMGDGVLAYFGYPRAHEDDAERAVRAGLEIAAAVGGR